MVWARFERDDVLRRALDFKMKTTKKWRRRVEEKIKKIGVSEEDALNRLKWRDLKLIASHPVNLATSISVTIPNLKRGLLCSISTLADRGFLLHSV